MPRFQIRVLTPDGELRESELKAVSEQAVRELLEARGQIPLSIQQPASSGKQYRISSRKTAAVEQFTQELSYLLSAGIPLEKSLTLISQHKQLASQLPIDELLTQLREGHNFSSALSACPDLFEPLYISMVRAAEATGDLADGLNNLHHYQQQSRQLKETLSTAMVYPAILALVSLLSILTILLFVIPQFAELLTDIEHTLPLHTQWILAASEALRSQGHWYALGLASTLLLLQLLLRHATLKAGAEQLKLRLPVIGPLLLHTEMARFCRSLGTLLSRGIPLLDALDIARQALKFRWMQQQFDEIDQQLRDGQQLAPSLARIPRIPEMMVQLVQVGEETGQSGPMLIRLAELFERQSTTRLRKLVSLLEPLLIVSLGLVIAVLVLSMLSAILSINNISL